MPLVGIIGDVNVRESKVEWKISNFLSLSAKKRSYYHSPTFHVSNKSFHLVLYPAGERKRDSVFISLLVENETNSSCNATLSVKKSDGTLIKDKSCSDREIDTRWGFDKFCRRSLLKENYLTILCDLEVIPDEKDPPGAFHEYKLDKEEVPFEPISFCATEEHGRFGPLDAKNLRIFLRRKLDGRNRRDTRKIILDTTRNLSGLVTQLTNLKYRMQQIKDSEKDLTHRVRNRITKIETVLEKGGKMPTNIHYSLNFSSAVKEALHDTETFLKAAALEDLIRTGDTEGHLNKVAQEVFRNTRYSDVAVLKKTIVRQLKHLRLRINANRDIERERYKISYKKVLKAIDTAQNELMSI